MSATRPLADSGRLQAPSGMQELIEPVSLPQVDDPMALVEPLAAARAAMDAALAQRFAAGEHVTSLLRGRAWAVEQLVLCAWQACARSDPELCLVAVGGFGRGVLHPHSDVDLMVLFEGKRLDARQQKSVETFVTLLWDAGFYLGHSVRNLSQCIDEAKADVATATSLIEARLLDGDAGRFARLVAAMQQDRLWPAREFFYAKQSEQRQRHQQFHDTAYNLEPNIKEGPGGLRDIQMIGWVAQRHFGGRTLHGLVEHGFLSEMEFADLNEGQRYLWKVRFALHLQAGRAEDRLLFEHQRAIALRLGYSDEPGSNAAVEAFMQDYYRTVTALERLNERLLQLFEEELLAEGRRQIEQLGEDYRLVNGYLGLVDEGLFLQRPEALMEMFLILARNPDIRGVRASAIRLVVSHLYLVDDRFRNDPRVLALFTELMSQEQGIYTQLLRMNRYGLLAAFLPQFAHIVGRMQFDLFHAYTVDQHILFVIRNLRRFAYGKYRDAFPHAPDVFNEVERPVVLYLAALFHDIAKGRDGDHSDLGAADARAFCSTLPLQDGEAGLIQWLVQYHLLMSQTAQKKDISDPEVVAAFARKVGTVKRLQHLYLLTVADISATSPSLWNGWKSGLLWELYQSALNCLKRGRDALPSFAERIRSARERVLSLADEPGLDEQRLRSILDALPDDVFIRFNPAQLEWAVRERCNAPEGAPVVAVRGHEGRAVSELFVAAPDYTGLFATTTVVLDELGINVLSARVITTSDEYSFDLFQVIDRHGRLLNASDRERLQRRLGRLLASRTVARPVERVLPRRLRPFVTAPRVKFGTARSESVSTMELECTDRPGLVSQVATALVNCDVKIHDAMIATLGDRVEDTFHVSDRADRPLDDDAQQRVRAAILELFN